MFSAYMLRCSDGSYYVGHSDDLERRIAEHQSGAIPGYTLKRRPITLVWSDTLGTREEAISAEQQLKGWSRAQKEALIAGDWKAIRALSRKSFDTGLRQAQPLLRTNGEGEAVSVAATSPPLIILVRPQLGENIGKAARAMLNFGLTELRLVAPRDGWPNPAAGPAASGADIVLERAAVFDTLADATADCTHVFATTVRRRGLVKPVMTPEQAAAAIRAEPGRAAILFGPERSGLDTKEVALARTVLTVPINPEFGSLNLAQAVVLVAYEWSKAAGLVQPTDRPLEPPAPQEELDGLYDHLEGMIEPLGYFFPADRAPVSRRTLRSVLTKAAWTSDEVRTMRGVLSTLAGKRQRRSNASNS